MHGLRAQDAQGAARAKLIRKGQNRRPGCLVGEGDSRRAQRPQRQASLGLVILRQVRRSTRATRPARAAGEGGGGGTGEGAQIAGEVAERGLREAAAAVGGAQPVEQPVDLSAAWFTCGVCIADAALFDVHETPALSAARPISRAPGRAS